MQYHCVQCDQVFTLEASDDKPRCPKCLRQHGLRPVEAQKTAQKSGRVSWPLAAFAVLLVAAGGGYALYRNANTHPKGQVPLRPIDADDLREDAKVIAGQDPAELASLLVADAAVKSFAERAAKGQDGAVAQAKAICAALAQRKDKQAFVPWPRVEAREGAPLTAAETAQAIDKDAARKQLYPLEVSALAVAALRSLGVPALLAEVYRYAGETAPLDPSGRLGYYALALPKQGDAPAQVFDAYGGRTTLPSANDFRVLTDAQALGGAYALRAQAQADNAGDLKAGLSDSEAAVKLSPSSASVRSVRGSLLMATGGVEAGMRELDSAVQLRNDAARRNNLATLGLITGNADSAAKEVAAALAEAPDFALGYISLATVHLMRGETDLARSELEKAERLEPDLAVLPQIWAQFYASANDLDQALAKAQEAVRRRPKDMQALLVLARVDRAAGRYDDMREQAQKILAAAPADQHERLKGLLKGMLGPTVFETARDDQDDAAGDQAAGPSLTGSPDNQAKGPRLLDDPSGSKTGSLQLGTGAPKLQLGDGDSKLKLKLDP
jgi:tetratricopeptide (TPR) repeat protein